MKGETGTFTYGNCFQFVPTYSNSAKMINHKTDKSTKLHLFERTEGWRKSFEGEPFTDKTSHWGETDCRNQLKNFWKNTFQLWKHGGSIIRQLTKISKLRIIKSKKEAVTE